MKVSHLHSNHSASRRTHDLRHTHKTMLTELGVPEVLQDERLGHHPPGMRSVYGHTTRRMHEELVDGLQRSWERELAQGIGAWGNPRAPEGL